MDPKDPPKDEADVISLDDARKRAEPADAGEPSNVAVEKTINIGSGEFLKPVMEAIARELANVADPDGVVRVGGSDEASRAKTAAVVKGLGVGLGQALSELFGKYAQKIETGEAKPPVVLDPKDDGKKPS
jgi:hypothetical protein